MKWLSELFKSKPKQDEAPGPASEPELGLKCEKHQVTGVKYHTGAIMALAQPNPDYKKSTSALQKEGCIYKAIYANKWSIRTVELAPEPDNPHDPKAVKVIADGQHIGYIKAGSCARIHKLLQENRIVRVTCEIGGGEGKTLIPDEDSSVERYIVEQDSSILWAKISIFTRP